jgi:hypothetical protein
MFGPPAGQSFTEHSLRKLFGAHAFRDHAFVGDHKMKFLNNLCFMFGVLMMGQFNGLSRGVAPECCPDSTSCPSWVTGSLK